MPTPEHPYPEYTKYPAPPDSPPPPPCRELTAEENQAQLEALHQAPESWTRECEDCPRLRARVKELQALCEEIGAGASLSVVRLFLWPPGRHYYIIEGKYRQRLLAAGRGEELKP